MTDEEEDKIWRASYDGGVSWNRGEGVFVHIGLPDKTTNLLWVPIKHFSALGFIQAYELIDRSNDPFRKDDSYPYNEVRKSNGEVLRVARQRGARVIAEAQGLRKEDYERVTFYKESFTSPTPRTSIPKRVQGKYFLFGVNDAELLVKLEREGRVFEII